MTHPVYFEDFHPGQKFDCGSYELTKEEIVAFAREFDPQPFHLDEHAAKDSLLGGLAASGWQVCAIAMRLATDHIFNKAEARGGAGVEDCRWLKPARPGDVLRLEVEVLQTRPHPHRPLGFVTMRWDVFNQREQVASIVNTPLFAKRGGT